MIVGSGLLARAFAPAFASRRDVLVFASGVSNSLQADPAAFAREAALLDDALRHDGVLLYFGTCSIGDADRRDTPYARHKAAMETRVLDHPGGLVLRLPQVVGDTPNPHTLTNFLRDRILHETAFSVWEHAERNLVDVDDVARIGARLVEAHAGPRAVAIAAPRPVRMPALVAMFERVLDRRAHFTLEPRGAPLRIDAAEAHAIAGTLGIDMDGDYVDRLIGKYYARHR